MFTETPAHLDKDMITIDSATTVTIETSLKHVKKWVTVNKRPDVYLVGLDSGTKVKVTHTGHIPGVGKVFVAPSADVL